MSISVVQVLAVVALLLAVASILWPIPVAIAVILLAVALCIPK